MFIQPNLYITLAPATWYMMEVTAVNSAGKTKAVLKFATHDYQGCKYCKIITLHSI